MHNDITSAETVAIIGLGYVGLPLALLADRKGYKVIGIDVSTEKVKLINEGKSPIADKDLERDIKASTLIAKDSFESVVEVDIVVICVPTPVHENKLPDYGPVESACKGIAPYVKKGQLIVLESTVNPGVCEDIVVPLLEKEIGLKAGVDFFVAHCPERINPGDPNWNVSNIPRVVGGLEATSLEKALAFYRSIVSAEIKPMGSLKEAEAVKVVENSFRNVNIAFVNELARSFSKLGIDVVNVINGAATKPFAFMAHYPGCGVGGHCIPVDPYYLIEYAKAQNGFEHQFLSLACKTNEDMPLYTAALTQETLKKAGKDIAGAKVTVLGLSYKKEIGDCRESPAFNVIKQLKELGADVRAFDPHVLKSSDVATLEQALLGADAVVIATDHSVFKNIAPSEFLHQKISVVVDGRNCLDKQAFISAGIHYAGIGR